MTPITIPDLYRLNAMPPTLQRRHTDEHITSLENQIATLRIHVKGVETQQAKQMQSAIERQSALMDELRKVRLEGNPALTHIREDMDTIMEFINGNGHDGAKIRFDRLERSVKFIGWVAGAIALTTIGQLVNSVLGTILK